MPGWKDVNQEILSAGSASDVIRRKYLARLGELTGRNVILYYSGWLQKPAQLIEAVGSNTFSVSDADKSAFMAVIHELDRTKGLDLILHTPGGDTAATESLVQYLHDMFGHNIRAIVPQIAMSAGTMIACACNEIVMGAHSNLGPVDPQFGGIPAHGVVEEFERARREIAASPAAIPLWQPIIAKYSPTFVGECEKALLWSREIVAEWLVDGMFAGQEDPEHLAKAVVEALGDHAETRSHGRHISLTKAREIGLRVTALEQDKALQDAVLSVHHAVIQTFQMTAAVKIVENQHGIGSISMVQILQSPSSAPPVQNAPIGQSAFPYTTGVEQPKMSRKKFKKPPRTR